MKEKKKVTINTKKFLNLGINELNNTKHSFTAAGTVFWVPKRYEYIKVIGQGAYGVVVSAMDKIKKQKVAIKKVPNAFVDLIDAKRIVREIRLLEFFKHDNITYLLDVLKPEDKNNFEDIYLITDLMETDLHKVIYSNQDLSDDHIQYFMYQLLRGVQYIHSSGIIHRDLKHSNLLLNKNCDLKICDFGLARGFSENSELTEYVVTRWYRAPEIILNASEYTKAIDIWSSGCIMAEILARAPLFPGQDYLDQIRRIIGILGTPNSEELSFIENEQAKKYIKNLPKRNRQSFTTLFPKANPVALDLLNHMLVFNPNKRFSVEQCLNHPYFESLHQDDTDLKNNKIVDWKWDDFKPTKAILQSMIYEISLRFQTNNKSNC